MLTAVGEDGLGEASRHCCVSDKVGGQSHGELWSRHGPLVTEKGPHAFLTGRNKALEGWQVLSFWKGDLNVIPSLLPQLVVKQAFDFGFLHLLG